MKTLITWFGFREDFNTDSQSLLNILPTGFTGSIHKDIFDNYKFDRHLILFTQDNSGQITKELSKRKFFLKEFFSDQSVFVDDDLSCDFVPNFKQKFP